MDGNAIIQGGAVMKNTLLDLNNHLFAEMERLGDEDLKGEALAEELQRASGISNIAKNIIENASVTLQATKFMDDHMNADLKVPKMLVGNSHE